MSDRPTCLRDLLLAPVAKAMETQAWIEDRSKQPASDLAYARIELTVGELRQIAALIEDPMECPEMLLEVEQAQSRTLRRDWLAALAEVERLKRLIGGEA